jgi:hypothetical protein
MKKVYYLPLPEGVESVEFKNGVVVVNTLYKEECN